MVAMKKRSAAKKPAKKKAQPQPNLVNNMSVTQAGVPQRRRGKR
jgi:hypothetical protein